MRIKNYFYFLSVILAFLAGSVLSTVTTIALANGGDPDIIHGCVNNTTGSLRIVGVSTSCNSNETALNWNEKGLPGTGALLNNLHGASLNNTDFSYRTLKDDNFTGTGCSLSGDTFNHTDLTHVNITGCGLGGSHFLNIDFTTVTLGNNSFINASISNSNFANKNLTGDNLDGIQIDSSNLTNDNISTITFGNNSTASFTNSDLTNVNYTNSSIQAGSVIDFNASNVTNTNFTGFNVSAATAATFTNITGSNTNFTNANLSGAIFSGANLTTPIWSNTTCPDGTNSNDNGNTCVGHGPGL